MTKSKRYEEVDTIGGSFRGKNELLKHLNGETLTARQSIRGKCYECMGYFADGKCDCKIEACPLYPFMSYKEGGVRKSRVYSTEQREQARVRFMSIRKVAKKGSGVTEKRKVG